MRLSLILVVCGVIGSGRIIPVSAAEPTTSHVEKKLPLPSLQPPTQEWRSDPACQLVFFAVLEGLYTDGVPDEVVDLIVPPKAEKDGQVERCFVFRCPMCHAAYEAFVLYQRRQAFNGSNDAKSTFGRGFDAKIIDRLKSDVASTRVKAMGDLIRPWIDRKIDSIKMTVPERDALIAKMLRYAEEGNNLFLARRADPSSVYHEWSFYGGCQACEAVQAIARRKASENAANGEAKTQSPK
jgi:hypothetical protein